MSDTDLPKASMATLGCSNLLLCILCIADIAIGSVYLNECPQQPYIPIYLIVVGVFGLVMALFFLFSLFYNKSSPETPLRLFSILYVISCSLTPFFLFCWFIAGNVWIYSIYVPNYNKNMTHVEPYCNKTLYLFAFWTTTVVSILLLLCSSGGGYSKSKSYTNSSVTVTHVSSLGNNNVPA